MSKFKLNPERRAVDLPLEHKRLDYQYEAGWIGRFFGIGARAEIGIIGFVAGVLVIVVPILSFFDRDLVVPYLSASGPIITGVLGYLFGRKS